MPIDLAGLKEDLTRRMDGAIETLRKEYQGLRAGRPSPALLETVRVDAYGNNTPLNQVASVAVAGPGLLSVQVWDKSLVKAVEAGIREAQLGLNPQTEGQVIRVPLPPLTEERRNDLVKAASKYAESTKIAIRGVRRDGMEQTKSAEKDKKAPISKDEAKDWTDVVQKLTDQYIKQIDGIFAEKEKDIKTV